MTPCTAKYLLSQASSLFIIIIIIFYEDDWIFKFCFGGDGGDRTWDLSAPGMNGVCITIALSPQPSESLLPGAVRLTGH